MAVLEGGKSEEVRIPARTKDFFFNLPYRI
jgi:hypothetical protein